MRRRYNSQNSVFISTEEMLSCNGNKYCIELLLRFLLHARQFLLLPSRRLQLYLLELELLHSSTELASVVWAEVLVPSLTVVILAQRRPAGP